MTPECHTVKKKLFLIKLYKIITEIEKEKRPQFRRGSFICLFFASETEWISSSFVENQIGRTKSVEKVFSSHFYVFFLLSRDCECECVWECVCYTSVKILMMWENWLHGKLHRPFIWNKLYILCWYGNSVSKSFSFIFHARCTSTSTCTCTT